MAFVQEDNKFPVGIEFHLDDINDPVFGSVTNLKGWLPFVLPPGIYKYPSILNEPKKLKEVVNELIPVCRNLYPDLLDEELFEKVCEFATGAALWNCSELDKKIDKAIILLIVIGFICDDIGDNLINTDSDSGGGEHDISYKVLAKLYPEIVNKLALQELDGKIDVNSFIPSISPLANALKEAFNKVCEYVTGIPLVDCALNGGGSATTKAACAVAEFKKEGHILSTTTQFEMYREITAMKPILNICVVAQNIHLNTALKSDILFQTILNNYADITVFCNAIFGLKRDIKNGGEDGPIIYLVTVKKWTLQKAYDEIYSRLRDAINDYMINSKKLMEAYGEENENLIKYLDVMGKVIDGSYHGYTRVKRYGVQDKIKLVY